ncbi:serine/threonine-protein kinase [Nonomuraea guangzhouensis]|uniref:Serine/threonine-protein kinase n=1 Tax=Nonomuraea guangzhouensis TaxID=1291555 RepID=A0ABW4GGV5_9ACTN|nr:serine/threonine-protein kinase [Nonomuraea guangzhouensis]
MTVPRVLEFREPERIGDYRISAVLGEGGQGRVYLGEAPGRAPVAIKVLHARLAADPEIRRRFLREAEVAASVAAFCTARVLGTGMAGERPYIVSEYVPGPSLDALVKTDGPRTGSGLERLAVATLTALASIHRAGIVHRDFKPGNVILGPEGPVVIDFGIARALDHMTSNTELAGTPAYMSPEQLTDQPLAAASDMFSWAGTMVFAATGRIAFPGQAVPAVLHGILSGHPDLSGVPAPLLPMVTACLAKDPAARPAAARLLSDLTGEDVGPPSRGRHSATLSNGQTIIDPAAQAGPLDGARFGPGGGEPDGPRFRPVGGEPDRRPTSPSGRPVRRRSSRGALVAVLAVVAAVAVTSAVLLVPSWLDGRERASGPDAPFNLATFPHVDVADQFGKDTSRQYATFQPHSAEAMPAIRAGGGQFTGTGSTPFFGLVAGESGLPESGAAVSVLTAGTFAGTGQPEDSVFVGWVKNGNSYVTAWYNNTRKESGLEVQMDGAFVSTPGAAPLTLKRGDRFALSLSGDRITSYAESGGTWRRLGTAAIGDMLTTARARQQYRYGFGLRGSTGTIGITRTEGRSAQD